MKDTTEREGAAVRIPPPLVPLLGIALGLATSRLGYSWTSPLQGVPRVAVGGLLVCAGLGCALAALGLFRESGQDPEPWKASPELIATGIYRWSRNPMYLGMGLLQAGIGVLLANLWVVVLVPVTWWVIYFIAIRPEEDYLETKFGDSYLAYKRSVRRWL